MLNISPPAAVGQKPSPEDAAVLSLTHFSRPPFLSFGCVRPGSARSAVLLLQNPSADPAYVTVNKLPQHRGFSVPETELLVPPLETLPLTITWTPLEEGGIRELVTFLLNDVVKHQAVLLGRAELPVKKKRSRWNTVKKKYSPVGSKVSCSNAKNKTIKLPHKSGDGTLQRTRSPLQSCENLTNPVNSPSSARESRRSSENRAVAGLVSPLATQLQSFTPGSLRRSKTYSVLCTTEYREAGQEVTTTSTVQGDGFIEEEWTLSEQRIDKVSMSPINPVSDQQGHFICTPSIIHECTAYPVLSPSEFCKTEITVKQSQTTCSFQESSHEHSRSVLSRSWTPPSVLRTPQTDILSPDSFVNNSYVVSGEYLTAGPQTPILSPDQFVKDNLLLTPQADSAAFNAFDLNTPPGKYSVNQEEVTVTRSTSGYSDHKVADGTIKAFEPVSSKLTICVKKPKERFVDLRNGRIVPKGHAKPPIIPYTVIKGKAGGGSGKQQRPRSPVPLDDITGTINPGKPPVISATVIKVRDNSEKQHRLQSLINEDVTDMKDLTKLPIISDAVTNVKAKDDIENQPKPLLTNDEPGTKDPVKPTISTATVVKVKAVDRIEMQHKAPLKSRRRLRNIESDGSVDSRVTLLPDLPVINVPDVSAQSLPSSVSSSESSVKVSKPKSICGHKRRSEEISRDVSVASSDSLENAATQAKKVQICKPTLTQRVSKQVQQAHSATVALKNAGRNHKVKAESMKTKPALAKSYKKDNLGLPPLQSAVTYKNSKRIVAVAQSKLTFIKTPKTVIPRHPMPFAAKNMFYDERWMAKQERGFTWWLNFILTPDDFAVKTDSLKVNAAALILGAENSHKVSVPKAPTKEEVSLKAYTARCRLNKLRRSACRLFTSEPVVRAIRRLEVEIEARRLLVRRDRHLWKDIGERQKILNWLLSYNPLWLRMGLETVYGELISLESNSDVTGLALFILNRLLWNPDIAAEYRHPSVPHLYRDGHEEALSKFTLKKLLLLVFFLDYAKQSRLIDHDPCLFCKDAEFKASKDILLAFSRDFLSGEGDLSRHLGYLGLTVGHVQTPLDEFDFAVTNLAVDLQCGIRLVRTMELLTQNWSLSKKLRVPAISRLQKMHNVEVALHVLTEKRVQIKDERGVAITSKDIVDRHRERTLALLWHIVFTFQVDVLLNTDHLKEEITFLRHSYTVQKKLAALRAFTAPAISKKRDSDAFSPDNYSERVLLLMEWVNAVCAFYSAKVENFTVSFSDGRVFCYLINHYHPSYIPLNAIRQQTSQTIECSRTGAIGLNSSSDSDSSLDMWPGTYQQGLTTSALFEELLENEKANFSLVQNAAYDLGGIPAMIHHSDMSNTIPDEKVVIIYLSFLCARILDIRKETRAARVIQAAWRRHRLAAEEQLLQRKHKAACVIQRAVCKFLSRRRVLRRISSALIIQKHWRRYLAYKMLVELKTLRQKEIETCAAVAIQKHWRGYAALKYYRSFKVYVVLMQARVRSKIAAALYRRTVCAVRTIQVHVRSWLLARKEQSRYLQLKSATAVIQSAYRRWKHYKMKKENKAAVVLQKAYRRRQQRRLEAKTNSAIAIQSQYRMLRERRKYLTVQAAVIKIQSLFKMRQERKWYLVLKQTVIYIQTLIRANHLMLRERELFFRKRRACVKIQSAVRGYLVRSQMKGWNKAATALQAYYRMHKARKEYLTVYRASVVIQRRFRAHKDSVHHRKTFLLMKQSAILLQATYRGHLERKRMRIWNAAAVTIQANYQCYRARKHYLKIRQSALTIQSWYRGKQQGRKEMESFTKTKRAISVIQAAYRGFRVRRQLHKQNVAAVIIQSAFRRSLAQKKFEKLKKSTLAIQRRYRAMMTGRKERQKYLHVCLVVRRIQAVWRGREVRREILRIHRSASLIQSYYKMHVCQTKYKTMKRSTERIQGHYRAYLTQKRQRSHYLKMKAAATVLQAAYRGWKTRKNILNLHKAACTVQAYYRSHRIRKQYLKLKMSATTVQRWYRNAAAAQNRRAEYLHLRRNVIKIQSIYRGMKTRKRVGLMRTSVTLIQSVFRMHKQRVAYQKRRQAAVVLQRHYRAVLYGRRVRKQYFDLRKAACTIQAAWRGRSLRKQIGHMYMAATVIQSQYRMFRERCYFNKLRRVTVAVQQRYHASQVRNRQMLLYRNMRRAALCIQSSFRAMKQRCEFKAKCKAARVIQRAVKSFIARRRFLALRNAAITVQKRYRLKRLGDHPRQEFIKLKKAALVLQAAYRSVREREKLQNMHSAATVIQAVFKMHTARVKFLNLKCASITIQRCYRSHRSAFYKREAFLKLRESAVILQAAYRGAKVRRAITKMHQAATKIQATYRMYVCKRNYKKAQWAVGVMQKRYRAKKMRDFEVLRYSFLKEATICMQASYRGWRVRKELRNQRRAAIIIQRQFRTYTECRRYLALKEASIRVQRLYRATVATRQHYRNYQSMRKAASCIQASYRGYKVRKDIQLKYQMATRIQACFRMHRVLVLYRAQREAACKLQTWYRSALEVRRVRGRFLQLYSSAVIIQAGFRGMRVRRNVKTMKKAATVIQSSYRMYVHYIYYKRLIKATKTIQRRYRGKKIRDQDMCLYHSTKKSALLLQAAFRGAKVRRQIKRLHHAATSIQKCVKAYLQRKKYLKLRSAAACFQRRYRALILARSERSSFLTLRKATTCIQSTWRAYKANEKLKQQHKAAAVIQASYRMYKQRKSYTALQQAARKIQLRFRANLLRNEAVEQFTRLKKATTCLQSAFRAMNEREALRGTAAALVIQAAWRTHQKRKSFLQMKSRVVLIQAAFRGHMVRKRLKEEEVSARCIQSWFRRCCQARQQRVHYLSTRASALVIQSAFRGYLARRIVHREKAARKLQAYLHMAVQRKRFLLLKKSAVTLQSHYRRHRMQGLYQQQRASAVLLQQWYRSLLLMRKQRMAYLDIRRRAICLQSVIRRFNAQRKFMKAQSAATIIQVHWRIYEQRKIFLQYKQAALIIQQRYRAKCLQMLHRHNYLRLRTAAIVFQSAHRASQARVLLRKERAACVIQRFYRSYTVRRNYITLIRTVKTVQRSVRAKQERARFTQIRKAAVCIQRRWRETLVARNIRKNFLQKQAAAKKLQSLYRGYVVRKEIHKRQQAAHVIQAAFRGFWHRRQFLRLRGAAVTLQQRFRALQQGRWEHLRYLQLRNSVIRLQTFVREWLARKEAARLNRERQLTRFSSAVHHHLCAVRIQRYFRNHLLFKKAQKRITEVIYIQRWYRARVQQRTFSFTRRKTITLQRAVRVWLQRRHEAAIKIQRSVRVFLQHRKHAKVMSGIVKFQALWRGHQLRKKQDNKAVKKLRMRLQKVNEQMKDEDRLCNRTVVAVNYLLTYKHLSFILAALQHLEVATRLSSVCCENMAQSGAVKTIFTLIRSCNRSIPCMEVIKLSIQVLLNLSKYEKTVSAVYEVENSVETLLDLMQIYREKAGDKVSDKGGSIFTKTCCLLAIFALNSLRAREMCAIPKAVDRICSIYKLTARKHKIDTARNIRHQLMNSSQNYGNISIQATPVRTRIVSRIKPDWVLRKDNMREVVDPLKAIQMVMLTFGLSI
ncbi:abnormal spindle-like microcephaly-associated protein [Bufo bufo]|uniref:abnormal spindle-like microcephaly-associated protein n=1 Tax=Bufo bufo TaxID=8384 RepID=UPI001ABDEDB1|nr:abnormal spindle-like microcephaly-associated protein [Bufo bufo]